MQLVRTHSVRVSFLAMLALVIWPHAVAKSEEQGCCQPDGSCRDVGPLGCGEFGALPLAKLCGDTEACYMAPIARTWIRAAVYIKAAHLSGSILFVTTSS